MSKTIEKLNRELLENISKETGLSKEYLRNAHISEIERVCKIKYEKSSMSFPWEVWDY